MKGVEIPTDEQVADFLGQSGMEHEEIDEMMKVWEYLGDGPGSSKHHHAYENGLKVHVEEMAVLAYEWYGLHERLFKQDLPFTLTSLIRVIFCHDLEKVDRYIMKYKKCTAKDLEPCLGPKGEVSEEEATWQGFKYIDNDWKKPSEAIQKYSTRQPEGYLAQAEAIHRATVDLGIKLTRMEKQAIYAHMLYFDYGNKSIAVICPLTYFLSCLDMMSANVYEAVRMQEEKSNDLDEKKEG